MNFVRSRLLKTVRLLNNNSVNFKLFEKTKITTNIMSTAADISAFTIPNTVPICQLDCTKAFNGLDQREKKYAHYLSKACNQGGLIVLIQTSPESPAVFMLLQQLFTEENLETLKCNAMKADANITEDNFMSLLTYASGFYSNMGNYKSFGDTKIIPNISLEIFEAIVKSSEAYRKHPELMTNLWIEASKALCNLEKRHKELGIGEKGVSTYYSSNITEDDIKLVQEFMNEKKVSPYNTRLFKTKNDGNVKYELRLASAAGVNKESDEDVTFNLLGKHLYKDHEIHVIRGDYAPLMKRVNDNLLKAKEYAANENEMKMIENYIKSFQYGSIDAHKDGSRYWIKNKGPIVENYIGFIESYRDPHGVRGEFEGFVSMVNKEMSAKFGVLVDKAEDLLKLLPWSSDYEKDNFLRPDFTSLDVLTFAGSGIPAGINIPNYDDIRQDEGFKNVSLGNVLQAATKDQKVTFLSQDDQDMYSKLKGPSFEVQVGLHELLGHGSGKLFQEKEDGSLNFDVNTVKHLETNEKVTTWYKFSETWDTKFGPMSSSYEECRAECVGLHLCLDRDILRIFGHDGQQADDILYINWLNMVRAGLVGLEFFSPESKSWKQAHMNARFVILQVLLEAGDEFVKLEETVGEDGQPDIMVSLDRSKIETVGRKAIAHFLMRLQLYKATADVVNGEKMYQGYSAVNGDMLQKRVIVLARKQPRRMFVQSNTKINSGGHVELIEYEGDCSGLVQSFVERYPRHDEQLEQLWKDEMKYHQY